MAGGDNGSSSRATTEDLSKEESVDKEEVTDEEESAYGEESAEYQRMFKHFKENKVEIASAITKPFPFLMSLRDRGFISEQKFRDSQERCQNLVPVGIVVYDILSDLQNKFSLPLLEVIFSKVHLKAYPDLEETLRRFLDDTVETGNNTTVGKSKRKRIPQLSRNEAAHFKAELLPVTCGHMEGVLHKRKFEQGVSVKSIQSEDGDWYIPPEFEILGGYEKSRNWRLSLRCYDRPLKLLIQKNLLPKLPKVRCRIKKVENS
ncbi:nuclear body protein SP140-like protein isoform X1 [Peromyscus californicus insignis]|uniref:nuclear body protein SP140-like protein isoform X1 n=1 Tax=Peromyscus californicus insignis TaxID=564181 RepID=UPI0022A6DEFF|nr:nuclear body protein SP140-like protein isoform X1 [Peromyscus californicus insignis]